MTTSHAADRFKALPDDSTLAATVVALEEHRFSVDVVEGPRRCARRRSRIPEGSSVMTNTSVTLQETGSANAIDDGGPYDSARNKMMALDFPTQLQEMKAIAGESPSTATAVKRARRRARSTSRPVASPPAPGHGEDDVVDLRIPPAHEREHGVASSAFPVAFVNLRVIVLRAPRPPQVGLLDPPDRDGGCVPRELLRAPRRRRPGRRRGARRLRPLAVRELQPRCARLAGLGLLFLSSVIDRVRASGMHADGDPVRVRVATPSHAEWITRLWAANGLRRTYRGGHSFL
jgi:hypothetical protein